MLIKARKMTLKKTETPDQTKRLFTNYVAQINYLESEREAKTEGTRET
jgi:hypothetical protein